MKRVMVFLLFMVLPAIGMAATIHVPGDQPTIQAGIDAAADGDTVLVAPGTYVENINYLGKAIMVVSEQGPDVTIIDGGSPSDPDVASVVTFESEEGPDSILEGFTVTNGTGNNFPGQGFNGGGIFTHHSSPTITGNIITDNLLLYDYSHGGGIFANNASPTITGNTISGNTAAVGGGIEHQMNCFSIIADNTITDNTGTYFGGGIALYIDCHPVISNNIISNNVCNSPAGYGGGGIQMDLRCSPTITGNTISGNVTSYSGGGIDIQDNCQPVITNNIFTDNSAAKWGGGIYCLGDDGIQAPTVNNNIFVGNSADEGGGALSCNVFDSMTLSNNTITGNSSITYGGGIECWQSSLVMINTISWDNTAPTGPEIWVGQNSSFTISYSDVSGGESSTYVADNCTLNWGAGMIDADPEFTSSAPLEYCLCQTACGDPVDSPCVGTGNGSTSWETVWGSTRTDHVLDVEADDMGFHYPGLERLVVGPGPGYDNRPLVRVLYPLQEAGYEYEFAAYGPTHYGVNVTCGDVNANDSDEIITGAGPGDIYGPHVRGFEVDGSPLPGLSFLAYGTNKYGVNVAAGDIDADGFEEIITGAGPGAVFGPHVRGWDYDGGPGEPEPVPGVSYFAYGTPKWGVNVACGDIDGDGYDEIVTGAGPGAVYGPHVRGWNVDGGAATSIPGVNFFAYGTLKYGVNVTCGDIDGDGIDEIVTGPGPGAVFGPHVRGWNVDGGSATAMANLSFFAWSSDELRYGANVFSGADLNGNGRDEIVVGQGPDPEAGTWVKVYMYDGSQEIEWFSFEAFGNMGLARGANVAAGRF